MGDFDLGLLDDDTYKVEVLRTKMLGIAEVFMYRLPSKCKSPYRWEQKKVSKAVAADPATDVQLSFAKESQPELDESQQESSSHIYHVFCVVRFVVNVCPIP